MTTLSAVRAAYGITLALAPPRVLRALAPARLDPAAVRTARVLGVRHLVQAVVLDHHRAPRWQLAGAAVDGAHAGSMLVLARRAGRPSHRRLARGNARTALALAVTGCARAALGPSPGQPRFPRLGKGTEDLSVGAMPAE